MTQLAGSTLIAGFGLWVLAMIVAPPNLYRQADLNQRVAIVERHMIRWYVSQAGFGLGMLAVGFGFLALARSEIALGSSFLAYIGGVALVVAGVIGAAAVYRQTFDPLGFWSGPNSSVEVVAGVALLVLTMLGLLAWGILFVFGFQPAWIGYLICVSAIVFMVIYALSRGRGAFLWISLAYLVSFVAGIALVRSGR